MEWNSGCIFFGNFGKFKDFGKLEHSCKNENLSPLLTVDSKRRDVERKGMKEAQGFVILDDVSITQDLEDDATTARPVSHADVSS